MNKVLAVLVSLFVTTSTQCLDNRTTAALFAVGRAFMPSCVVGYVNWRQQQRAQLEQKLKRAVYVPARTLNIGHGERVSFLQPNTPSTR